MAVALLVGPILTAAGIQVIYTRTSDQVPWPANVNADLQMRCDIANNAKADAFLSIHCNASDDHTAHGSESFCYALGGKGQVLAGDVLAPLVAAIATVNRGVQAANYEVLRNTSMPAALVETAFISDPAEEAMLRSPAAQAKIAQAIAQGICAYFNITTIPGMTYAGSRITGQVLADGHLWVKATDAAGLFGHALYNWNAATETLTIN